MRLGHAVLYLISTALICPSVLATDRGYGTVLGWGLLIDPDEDCSFTVAADEIAIGVLATPHGSRPAHSLREATRRFGGRICWPTRRNSAGRR